jgi:GntR family transcriptional regulator
MALWEAARAALRRYIEDGTWLPGTRIPAEPELAAQLGVSRATLREALRALHDEGLIARKPGAGTYVRRRTRLSNNLDANFGVTDLIKATGMAAGTRNLHIFDTKADQAAAEDLGLAPDAAVVVVERVRTADGTPVVFSRDVYPLSALPGGSEDIQRLTGASIYDFLEQYCGIIVEHGVARISPAQANRKLAELLDIPRGALLLHLRQIDYDEKGRPVLLSDEFHLADAFEITVFRRGNRSNAKASQADASEAAAG